MKSLLLLGFLAIQPASAAILVAFSSFGDDAGNGATAIGWTDSSANVKDAAVSTATFLHRFGSGTTGGSNDTFYGTSTAGAPTGDGYARANSQETSTGSGVRNNNLFTVTVASGSSLTLESLSMDSVYGDASSNPGTFSISYRIDGGASVVVTASTAGTSISSTSPNPTNAASNYADLDFSLGSINLAAGQTIVFNFEAVPNGSIASSFRLDNVALIGTSIPEPTSALLSGIAGTIMLLSRRRIA